MRATPTALVASLFLLTGLAAVPASQAVGAAAVITTAATTDGGDLFGVNCAVSTTGLALVSGYVIYGLNEERVGDAFYDDIVAPARPYGPGGGLHVNGVRIAAPGFSPSHNYVVSIPLGPVCFTFGDSHYPDNLGALAIIVA